MANKKIVILVPGIMGSQLYDGDELIWPGSTGDYAFGYSESKFQKLLKPNLIPQGVIESYYFNQYADIINPLKSMGFQRMSDPHTLPQGNHRGLYIFPYDWRKDNRISANELASFIDRIYHASQNNPLDITLLCHSMGGLVSRYYLESEALKSKKGLEKISQVIFMGTPHRGSTKAFFYLQGERAMLWMDADQVRRLSNHNNPSFSSLYQLLPTIDFPSIYERRGLKPLNIYTDPQLSRNLKLDPDKVKDAYKFHQELNPQKLFAPEHTIKIFCFYSAHHQTDTVALYKNGNLNSFNAEPAGDETVPVLSAWLQGSPSLSVEEAHSKIYASSGVLKFLKLLLEVDIDLAATLNPLTVTLTNPYLKEGGFLKGVIFVNQDIALNASGWKLTMQIAKEEEDGNGNKKETLLDAVEKIVEVYGSSALNIPFEWPETSHLFSGKYVLHYKTELQNQPGGEYQTEGKTDFVVLQEREDE